MAENLTETTIILIRNYIKANISAALASVRTERADAYVTTEPPQSYFISETNAAYRCPAVFIIPEHINFSLERGQNHINAKVRVNVSVVVEDRDTEHLAIKVWRYQAALHQILVETRLTTVSGDVTLVVKVADASFSSTYTAAQEAGNPQGAFRKEVALECDVEHWENF